MSASSPSSFPPSCKASGRSRPPPGTTGGDDEEFSKTEPRADRATATQKVPKPEAIPETQVESASGRPTPPPPASSTASAVVVILSGDRAGQTHRLDELIEPLVIGRGSHCDIVIGDPAASREHAELRRAGQGSYAVHDRRSRNGTRVNGETVRQRTLKAGDRIIIGDSSVLLFTTEDPAYQALQQQQKLQSLGELSAGIAHDFNNLLGVIVGTLDYIEEGGEGMAQQDLDECHRDIRSATDQAIGLVQQLLAFARSGPRVFQTVDLAHICEEVARLARRTLPASVEIDTSIEPHLYVAGDCNQLHQAVMNLAVNARDAMLPEGGRLTLRAEAKDVSGTTCAQSPGAGPQAVVTVSDTGHGMDDTTRSRIFDPFFTTRARTRGSGLGLAVVYQIVTGHGGNVEVKSAPGEGASFILSFPQLQCENAEDRTQPRRRRVATGDLALGASRVEGPKRVLLVDDEGLVRRAAGRPLRRQGHTILEATNGQEALEVYQQGEPPDVVFLDLDMPGIHGRECLRRLRELDPEATVLCMTGYVDEELERSVRAEGAQELLRKPLDAQALRDAVKRAAG